MAHPEARGQEAALTKAMENKTQVSRQGLGRTPTPGTAQPPCGPISRWQHRSLCHNTAGEQLRKPG